MSAYHNDSIAFRIGQDYAWYRLLLPDNVGATFVDGYRAGQTANPKTADRFVRKWLQVRTNAWRRNRHVNDDFTPELLRAIDAPACAVSGVTLTYGTGRDTDWSVDRIDNDGGYTRENILLVSTRVNHAKGTLTALDVMRIAYPIGDTPLPAIPMVEKPLTKEEWTRLAHFAGSTERSFDYPVRSFDGMNHIAKYLPRAWSVAVQVFITEAMGWPSNARDAFWARLAKFTDDQSRLNELRRRVASYAAATPQMERSAARLFSDDATWDLFAAWWVELASKGVLAEMTRILARTYPKLRFQNAKVFRDAKRSTAKGYA
ncbi:MAG: hypothetical protein JWR21_2619 [Herminiimonas sp.]|nr:hypothetical protein [Herminiimonas sp.]